VDDPTLIAADDLAAVFLVVAVSFATLVALASWRITVAAVVVLGVLQTHLLLDLSVSLASYRILLLDTVMLGVMVACGIRLLSVRRADLVLGCWIALAALSLFAMMRASSTIGLGAAAVSFRPDFYLVVAALYMQTFDWTPVNLDRFATLWLSAGSALALYGLGCWIEPALIISPALKLESGFQLAYMQWRVLPASSALLIASAGLIGFALWTRSSAATGWQLVAVLLLIMVALLYHRSVWVSAVAGVAAAVLVQPQLLGRLLPPLALTMLALFLIWTVGDELVASAFDTAVSEPFDASSTWEWRTRNWRTMIPETIAAGWTTTLFGWGYGIGFEDPVSGLPLSNPHNAYVQMFVNMGLLGLGVFGTCLTVPLWFLWRRRVAEGDLFDRTTAMTLLVALIVYCVPYSPSIDQGILAGVISGLASRARMTPRAALPDGRPVRGAGK